jgi:hypothetical protein
MPSLKYNELLNITNCNNYNLFIETGTCEGSTTFEMCNHFKYVHSIELYEPLYNTCLNSVKKNNIKNVELYHGESIVHLNSILSKVNEPCIFFLDGHWSGSGTGRGSKDCPLLEELNIISKHLYKHIIVIDDYRLFGIRGNEDWSDITDESVLLVIGDRLDKKVVHNDRLYIFLKENL